MIDGNRQVLTRAVVLAAGRGRRLRPFTDDIPKPLLPLSGRPTLDYILTALAQIQVSEVCLVTHYLAEQIETYVGDGSRWGLRTHFRRQPGLQGTAAALKTAVSFLTGPTLVLAADYALPADYLAPLRQTYLMGDCDLAVSLREIPPDELAGRSSVAFDENGRISRIVEKPDPAQAPSHVGASLIYIVPPAICPYLTDLTRSERGEYELPHVLNRMLADGYCMNGCIQPPPPEWQKPEVRDEG